MNNANGGNIIFKFLGDDSGLKKTTQSIGGMTKSIIYATGITKALSAGWNMLTGSMDQAIARYDTLNNFPRVMSNLGVASAEADKSIKKMSDKLAGLPTTLDQGAMAVQRFTSANGDIEKSTDLFLALNNAILSGGASTEIQASALEQLTQAYSKGKPDMMEWRTAMTAMPAQLKQVAKAMGYVNADELGQALREGAVSMDEFMNAIVRLNTEGVDGFQSFEQQARNGTAGIRTSITVAKTQVVKGVADIVDAFNTNLSNTKLGSIGNVISEMGKKAKLGLDKVADVISGKISVMDFGKEITEMVNKMIVKFTEMFPALFNKGVDLVLEFAKGIASQEGVSSLITNTINLVDTMTNTIIEKFPDAVETGLELVVNLANGIADNLPLIEQKALDLTNKIIDKLSDEEFLGKVASAGGKILGKLVVGIIAGIPNVIVGLTQVKSKINQKLWELPGMFWNMGVEMIKGLWEGVKSQIGNLGKQIQNALNGIVAKAKKALKIASPSRVFRDEIGAMMGEGLGIGFVDSMDSVQKDMQRAINNSFGMGLNPALENSLHYSPNVIVNNNIEANTDPLGQTVMKIKTFAGGAKNDYNYGMGV